MEWEGKVVAIIENAQGFPGRIIYLIETTAGDRIWRFEEELNWAPGISRRQKFAKKRT